MLPAYLIRASIDWVRHHEQLSGSNPYSRCQETIETCQKLWEEQIGSTSPIFLESAAITAYWSEFFHAVDPSSDEKEWREGLIKKSGQYDSFDQWQDWFKTNYQQIYQENNIWKGVLMTSWAHTHQYEVTYSQQQWDFLPATSYLPTPEMWRLEPHLDTISEILHEIWHDEIKAYERSHFQIEEQDIDYLGKVECLGFDTKKYNLLFPPKAKCQIQPLLLGEIAADIVAPAGDDWYRRLDHVIFAHEGIDATALISRAKYVFGSQRRLFELAINHEFDQAKMQALAEGWLVPEPQIVGQ